MRRTSFFITLKMIGKIYLRDFYGPFFSLVFPILMLLIFGGIYGNEPSPLFGDQRGAMDVMIPALVAMITAVNGIMTLPLNLTEYMGNKVYKRFDVTPLGKGNLILAQIIIYAVATLMSAVILITFGKIVYAIRIDGSWLLIILFVLLACVSMFSLGFFLSAIFKNGKLAQILSYILYFVMIFLSGATIPLEIFPDRMREIANILPLTHVVTLLQSIFVGHLIGQLWQEILLLSLLTIFCCALGLYALKRRKWA